MTSALTDALGNLKASAGLFIMLDCAVFSNFSDMNNSTAHVTFVTVRSHFPYNSFYFRLMRLNCFNVAVAVLSVWIFCKHYSLFPLIKERIKKMLNI